MTLVISSSWRVSLSVDGFERAICLHRQEIQLDECLGRVGGLGIHDAASTPVVRADAAPGS